MALVIGSVFYNLPNDTGVLYSHDALLFFVILLASFASALEAQRPIVEQSKYAFYHPFAEAVGKSKNIIYLFKLTHRSLYDLRPAQQDTHSYWIRPCSLLHD
ncbi:hypothetical protein F5882DRAFT_469977 [Hyaloscypha sp. PMI_1271]|nr:hypothetical protein F5882DRAFT_469977 [Hyaloscypha sp. PMI_1271]